MSGSLQRALLAVLLAAAATGISLEDLDDIVNNRPADLCPMVECINPYDSDECPQGTRWIEGVFMGGCCGGCVRFQQESDICTGKIDPHCCPDQGGVKLGAGYGNCNPPGDDNELCDSTTIKTSSMYHPKAERNSRPTSAMSAAANAVMDTDFVGRFRRSLAKADELESVTNVLYSSWCDYGMYCWSNRGTDKCVMEFQWVTCLNTREAYDMDLAHGGYLAYRDDYRYRPDCDAADETYFAPKQCKSSSNDNTKVCVCVNSVGDTIEGKAFSFQGDLYEDMNCLCSRRKYELQQAGGISPTLHCQPNGNYEELQCDEGWCYCIHPSNGSVYGYQMPEPAMNLLPCFNRTVIGDQYLRQCESREHAHNVFVNTMTEKGILVVPSPPTTCGLDGSYAARHCEGSSCSCFSKYNKDCIVDGYTGCACMADKLVYDAYGRSYTGLLCDGLTGAYDPDQQFPGQQAVYLVDDDGVRVSSVVAENCQDYLRISDFIECQNFGNRTETTNGTDSSNGPSVPTSCQSSCSSTNGNLCLPSVYMFNVEEYNPSSPCVV